MLEVCLHTHMGVPCLNEFPSTNYSTHLCLIAPCFVSTKLANITFPAYSHCVVADVQSPSMVLVAL